MAKRTYRSRREWQKLIEQQAQSGLSGLEYCIQQGLSAKTFYRQRKRMRQQNLMPVSGSFFRVQSKAEIEPGHTGILFQHRESRLSIPYNADPIWLAQLLKAL